MAKLRNIVGYHGWRTKKILTVRGKLIVKGLIIKVNVPMDLRLF